MKLSFTNRNKLSAYEWDPVKKDWRRPAIERNVLKGLSERSSKYNAVRISVHFLILLACAGAAIYLFYENRWILSALFAFIYYFFFGFIVAPAHELQHKIVFSREYDRQSEIIFYILQFLMLNSPTYARVSHRLHHRYTMVRDEDPETDWPVVIDRKWLWGFILKQLMRLLLIGALIELFIALIGQISRMSGRLGPVMSKHTTEIELQSIKKESFLILTLHIIIAVVAILLQWWWLLAFITIAWHIGVAMEGMWHITEHVCRSYNVNDHRLCTRSIKVSRFIKYFYWGLDDHVDHHYFPAVPSYNLPKLHSILSKDLAKPANIIGCWAEMFAIAKEKEVCASNEYLPVKIIDQHSANSIV